VGSLPILDDLPAGYFSEESPGGVLVMHADVARGFHGLGFGPESDGTLAPSDVSGRSPLGQLEVDGQRFLVRRFRHGGMFRWLTGARYLDAERPFRELIVANSVARSGVRTPQVVAARAVIAGPGLWNLDVVTRRIDQAIDYGEVLERIRAGEVEDGPRARLFEAAGALVRQLHEIGFVHADLQPRNLLVRTDALEGAKPEPWIIDLEGSSFRARLEDGERRANLRRLYRALRRRESRGEPFLRPRDVARFGRGYDPSGERRRADWRAVRAGHARAQLWHRAGWALERVAGADPSSRDGAAEVRS
jgi:tRNA A-37 threonylcarbamoyl transferase component Bud32